MNGGDSTDAAGDGGTSETAPSVVGGWRFGASYNDVALAATTTSLGHLVIGGYYAGVVDFGGGAVSGNGNSDAFVAKYGAGAVHQQSIAFGNTGIDETWEVKVDSAANLYIVGRFADRLDFGNGNRLVSAGGADCFIVAFTSTGTYRWSHAIGGPASDYCFKADTDPAGNLYVFGYFFGTADFGDGSFAAMNGDIFVASYAPDGTHRFTRRAGGANPEWAYGGTVNGNTLCMTGEMRMSTNLGGDGLASTGDTQAWVACYDIEPWTHRFSRLLGGTHAATSFSYAHSVAIDDAGNVYVTGGLGDSVGSGTFDFGSGPHTNDGRDVFVVAFDSSGMQMFGYVYGGAGDDLGRQVRGNAGGAYFMGEFGGTIDIGDRQIGQADARWGALFNVSSSGTMRWAVDLGAGLPREAVAIGNHLWIVGSLNGTISYTPQPLSSFGHDVLLLELDGH